MGVHRVVCQSFFYDFISPRSGKNEIIEMKIDKHADPFEDEVSMVDSSTAGYRFRAALAAEKPLQIVGVINAYAARLAERAGFKALYLSGGGVAAASRR